MELIKLILDKEAAVYRLIDDKSTAVKLLEVCRIKDGRLTITYGKPRVTYAYQSEFKTLYKKLKPDEYRRIVDILTNSLSELET